MKSYSLAPISPWFVAVTLLTTLLDRQDENWLLRNEEGDVIAYFHLVKADDTTGLPMVQVDVSGRHYNDNEVVLSVLKKIQHGVGGQIAYAP